MFFSGDEIYPDMISPTSKIREMKENHGKVIALSEDTSRNDRSLNLSKLQELNQVCIKA